MPVSTFALLIAGVIIAAALTVTLVIGVVPVSMAGWALPGALICAAIARYVISRTS